jgi:hypothetical protein
MVVEVGAAGGARGIVEQGKRCLFAAVGGRWVEVRQ